MERWRDEGLIVGVRPHGEGGAVVSALTRERGRHAGYVYGGAAGGRLRALLQPGTVADMEWSARMSDQLGVFAMEDGRGVPLAWLDDAAVLAAVQSVCGMLERALPEREPYPSLYAGTLAFLETLGAEREIWGAALVLWELALLRELGFGLDLTKCVVTGAREGLRYVSPKSGGAVSEEGAGPYRDRLFPLPGFLCGRAALEPGDIQEGLALSAYFLENRLFAHTTRALPEARARVAGFFDHDGFTAATKP